MRRLHGEHIFRLPYLDGAERDFPLTAAVSVRAAALRGDPALRRRIDAAYARYLEPRGALVHGDVQPSNVLLAGSGAKLLDAEIAHVGDPAFDVGVLLAHLIGPAVACGETAAVGGTVDAVWSSYAAAHGGAGLAEFADVARHAGIELLRRTLGAARVAWVASDAAALAVLEAGARLVRRPPESPERLATLLG
jgi:5-methylthioribose kinase